MTHTTEIAEKRRRAKPRGGKAGSHSSEQAQGTALADPRHGTSRKNGAEIESDSAAREELQCLVEELEVTNEELRVANEELASSGGDIQALNRQLASANRQLTAKVSELERARRDLGNLMDASDVPTLVLGPDLRIRRFTPSAMRLFRLIGGDVGRPVGDLAAADDLASDVSAVLDNLVPRQKELVVGDGRWYLRRVRPYRAADNRIDGVVVTYFDVTPLKHAEEELRQQATELGRRVADRTMELRSEIRERLRAEAEARRRHAELAHIHRVYTAGELATALAHEINQPLAAIASLSDASLRQLRRDVIAKEDLEQSLEKISAQAQRAAQTIRELRSFLAKDRAERRRCDLNELVQVACNLIETDARHHGVGLSLDLASALPPVLAEPVHIEHVLINLIRNGIEAIGDAGMAEGLITVQTRDAQDGTVQVCVRDSGPGVDEATLRRIFEPFYTTKSKGLGMGLCISRTIVEAHQGRLWGEAGPGGRFGFSLPASDPAGGVEP